MAEDRTRSGRLVQNASRGDAAAVEELLQQYLEDLRGYVKAHARGIVLERESSSDLLQSVCREVLGSLERGSFRYQGEGQFRKWLFQAALLKIQQRHRYHMSEKRNPGREQPAGQSGTEQRLTDFLGTLCTPSKDAELREQLDLLHEAFDALPENQRDILMLSRIEGLSHAEIAQRLGITAVNSRVLLSRAVARLARLVGGEGGSS